MKHNSYLPFNLNLRLFLLAFLFFTRIYGQAAGDYGAYTSGTWGTSSIWKVYDGSSWTSSPLASISPNSNLINCYIFSSAVVTLTVSQTTCNNLIINSGGKLFTNSGGSNTYLYVYGNITCNGIIGNGATFDAISFGIEGASCLFTGTGTVDCSRIRKNLNSIYRTDLTIDININLKFATGSQTQIYNSADNSIFNVTLNAGKILNLAPISGYVGNVAMDGINGNDPSERSGSYTINGTLIISGFLYLTTNDSSLPCSFTISSTGIVQANSVIANISGPAMHTLNMLPGALLQITGTPFTNPFTLTNNNYNLSPGSTIEYSAPGTQTVDSNLTYANLKISGSGNKTGEGPLNVSGNISITGGVLIPYPTIPLIYLGGGWTDYSTSGFNENGSTVIFNGTANQPISVTSGGEDFSTMRINKPSGKVTLSGFPATIVRVINLLDLTSGNILSSTLTATYYLQIQNTASVINTSDNSFVEGACARQLIAGSAINFIFPVGKISKFRPETITGTPSATSIILGEYFKADPNTVGNVTQLGPGVNHVSRCEYWRTRLIGTATAQNFYINLSWDTYSACPLGVTLLSDLRVASWNLPTANVWNNLGGTTVSGSNLTVGSVTDTALFSFVSSAAGTPFTLSSVSVENPLPVELLYFTATTLNQTVRLNWSTASEINNDEFEIRRSADGINFSIIGTVNGAGNSTDQHLYEFDDSQPLRGISYYRLNQVDYDGKSTLSEIVAVKSDRTTINQIILSPVPVKNKLNIFSGESTIDKKAEIIQSDGRIIKSFSFNGDNYQVDVDDFNPGIYFININSNGEEQSFRFIKQ